MLTHAALSRSRARALCAFLLAASAASIEAQPWTRNPFTSASDLAAGARMFRTHCAHCHGRSGTGDRGPDLTRRSFRYAASDATLFRIVSWGIPPSGMPGIFYARSENAVWQIVAFVRSLSASPSRAPLPGDPVAGEKVYRGKGGCAKCHMVDGAGGRLGPDLSDIGWLRPPEHLRTSLVEPSKEVLPRWWSVRVTDLNGATFEGLRLNEDTLSVRLIDAGENLRSFDKRELKRFERIETSTMPGYSESLTARELDDLVAYLGSRGAGRD